MGKWPHQIKLRTKLVTPGGKAQSMVGRATPGVAINPSWLLQESKLSRPWGASE